MKALEDIIKHKNHIQREIDEAEKKIQFNYEAIEGLKLAIARKTHLVREYEEIIEIVEGKELS